MSNESKAGAMSMLAQGMQGLTRGLDTRDSARLEKKRIEQEMKQIDYADKEGLNEAKIDTLTAELKATKGQIARAASHKGLRSYTVDQNPKHLMATIDSEQAKRVGLIGFRKVNASGDSALYSKFGFTADDFDDSQLLAWQKENENFSELNETGQPVALPTHSRFVVGTMKDGKEMLLDVFKFKQGSGYFKELTKERINQELALSKAAEPGESRKGWSDWKKKAVDLEEMTGASAAGTMGMQAAKHAGGVEPGKIQMAEQREDALEAKFEGDFRANFDPYDQKQRNMAERDVEAIEQLRGINWSASELSVIQDMASLISLGDPSKTLTDEETGLYDNTLFNVKKYLSDEPGSGANEAYASFRNSLRNALYGSALTDHEIAAFNEQLGSLKMKRGPLLKQMTTSLEQVQAKLESIYNMKNSYVSTYRLGLNQDRLAKSISALKQNVKRIEALGKGLATNDPVKTEEQNRASRRTKISEELFGSQ